MSNTADFTYCVQMGITSVKEIFHLAFKNEPDCFPHNVGPITRDFSGQQATINVVVLDDDDRPADLSFQDDKHILFALPFDMTVELPDAPDPSLSRLTISATAHVPGLLSTWSAADNPVLGITFADVTPADVSVTDIAGLPTVDVGNITTAIHSRYEQLPHVYTAPAPAGEATLNLYDGTRDSSLAPPLVGNPEIAATVEPHGGSDYLKVIAPIHVDIPYSSSYPPYRSPGTLTFWRTLTQTDTTISVSMGSEPGDAALETVVTLDNQFPQLVHDQAVTQLQPLAVAAIGGFGTITEPAFSVAAATAALQQEIAAYAAGVSFGLYTPVSPDPVNEPLTEPVGFLLPADGVLAILLTRLRGSAATDSAPDNFLGGNQLALAVAAEHVVARSDQVIQERFPGVNTDSGSPISTTSGNGTLKSCHAAPADDGDHGESPGHLWVTGEAEVHIDCWPDPDVSFDGPVFIDATPGTDETGACMLDLQPRAGEFDAGQSCCDVLLDLLIPVVGWIMLAVVESMIDSVGGEIASQTADQLEQAVSPIPRVVIGVAQIEACLTGLTISRQGFVLPGTLSIRRDGTSFEDLHTSGCAPRPDHP